MEIEDGVREIADSERHRLDALSERLLGLFAVGVPRSVVGPTGRDHLESLDLQHPTFAQLDHVGFPDDVVHLHLVVVSRAHEDTHAGAAQLLFSYVHPAPDAVREVLLEGFLSLVRVHVKLLQAFGRDVQWVVPLPPDLVLDVANLVGRDHLTFGGDGHGVVAVLLNDRDHRLAGHVATADQYFGVIELRGVQELAPAHLGAVQVGGEKDSWHQLSLHQHFANLPLEPDDVPLHDLLGSLAVAGEDRLQQLDVLLDRFAQAHSTIEDQVPKPKAEVEVPVERVFEKRIARRAIDLAVDRLVELHELALVGGLDLVKTLEEAADRHLVGGGAALRGQLRRVALEND